MIQKEDEIVIGNVYQKFATRNPLFRKLVSNYQQKLDGLVERLNPSSIHEVGCGEGHVISRYIKAGRKLSATDFSWQIIEAAKKNYPNSGIVFKVESVYDLSPENKAELILCCEVLEHLKHPIDALEKLNKIAIRNLVVAVPQEPIWQTLNMLRGSYIRCLGNTPGHIQHWSKRQIVSLLGNYFKIEEVLNPFPWTMVLCSVFEEVKDQNKGRK